MDQETATPQIKDARHLSETAEGAPCALADCAATGRYEVRIGTSTEPGRVQVLCKRHYQQLWWGGQRELITSRQLADKLKGPPLAKSAAPMIT